MHSITRKILSFLINILTHMNIGSQTFLSVLKQNVKGTTQL